ncbi:hypothetical protein B7C42_00039 [Nocardia cerradoensis]|uniref:Uncharacterized protein n=1 Tax=Nocardia cerradoensis TaxID=85688 RepID=A0A231HDF2_9NOCA|nr:hypothetical protein B7C42_00039 [Nocardia cerradoensis]
MNLAKVGNEICAGEIVVYLSSREVAQYHQSGRGNPEREAFA